MRLVRSCTSAMAGAALLGALPVAATDVTLYRDAMGVPHVFADTSAAVMYGAGYALAQDRLAGMELRRRGASGRRAELLGASAIDTDRTARDRRLPDAELMRMYRAIPAEHQAMMQAYVDGINRAIAEVAADPARKTPLEFIRWGIVPTPWTLIDYLGYVASVPSGRDSYEIQNLQFLNAMIARHGETIGRRIFDDIVPVSDPDSPTVIPSGEDLAPPRPMPVATHLSLQAGGVDMSTLQTIATRPAELRKEASRCLVIAPAKSASGRVLMLQATADGPEIHLHGGGFDQTGFNFNAYGPPAMGRGVQHGWLLTSGVAQGNSIFAERLNPRDRHQYWFKGAWKTMAHRLETIQVKGAAPVRHEVAWTVHGPVVNWDVANGVAYSHSFGLRGREIDNWVGIVDMGRARNITEFEAGVDRMGWNLGICYGGEDGQIAFWEAGSLPILAPGVDLRLPIPGTGEHEWRGFLKPAERPHMLNPKQGYFHAWNSKATGWSPEGNDARIGAAFRTWAGSQLAEANSGITLLDMLDYNGRIFSALGASDRNQAQPAMFAPVIRAGIAGSSDPEVAEAAQLMLSFNGHYEDRDGDRFYDNAGATLWRQWLATAPAMIFGDSTGDWWKKVDEGRYLTYQTSLLLRALQGDKAGAPLKFDYFSGRDRNTVLAATIKATIEQLRPRYPGKAMADWKLPIFWKYYDPAAKTAARPALPDDEDPPRLSAQLKLGPIVVPHNGAENWVGLMEIDPDHPAIYSVVDAGGQNQFIDPQGRGNPHLTDQSQMHDTNVLKKIVMTPDEVRATAVSTQIIEYTPR